ncbi:MAG TPA: hypothetical protein DCY79_02860 [Planctomycetaceae bacterium]|nr:hypothetical protein [Blastopirellula sp.]HAY78731.1 hypothetical protein [Planctomycetaceae bacterium]
MQQKRLNLRSWLWLGTGLCLGLCVGLGMMIGTIVAYSSQSQSQSFQLPETLLQATASHGSDQFAIATGPVAPDVEGVFFLDYITGDLTCLVIYPRTGKFGAKYTVNVVADLGIEQGKTPKYVMVTGGADFRAQNTGNLRPGGCVVYVADANTGAFVAYGMPWNNAFANTGRPQGGTFSRLGTGKARELDLDN